MTNLYSIALTADEVKALVRGLHMVGNYEYEHEVDPDIRVGVVCDDIERKLRELIGEPYESDET